MAGNVVLLKHSTTVQQCAEAIDLLFRDANFPVGAYTNLVITAGLANKVVYDDRVQGVSFTGSDTSGARVAKRAGRYVKKTIMELGGSDPFVVSGRASPPLRWEIRSTSRPALRRCLPLKQRQGSKTRSPARSPAAPGSSSAGSAPPPTAPFSSPPS